MVYLYVWLAICMCRYQCNGDNHGTDHTATYVVVTHLKWQVYHVHVTIK